MTKLDIDLTRSSDKLRDKSEGSVENKGAALPQQLPTKGHEEGDDHCCICLHADSFEDNPIIFCEGECGMAATSIV